MNGLVYRGYSAAVEYDADDRVFVGHILGIRDIVGCHGSTVDELERAFQEAVDHYLAVCEQIGQTPQRPYSGKLRPFQENESLIDGLKAAVKVSSSGESIACSGLTLRVPPETIFFGAVAGPSESAPALTTFWR